MSDTYVENNDDMTSEFNEAQNQILRLGNQWNNFSEAILSGNFLGAKGANWILDNIFGELSPDAEKEDKNSKEEQKYSTKIKKIDELISNYKHNTIKLYKLLRFKEKILRRLQNDAGKGARYSYADGDLM